MILNSPTSVRGGRAALLLVVTACATPGRASADCGDHVVVLAPGAAAHDAGATGHRERPQAPCSGPNCSRAPERHAPQPAPVASPAPHGKEAAHATAPAAPDDRTASRPPEFTSPRPLRRAVPIFHPPRAG